MNLQKLLMMILNPLLRRLITKGVDAGFDRFSGPDTSTPEQKAQSKQTAKRLRQTLRIGRKLW